VDRELGPAESASLEAHLDGCPRCQGRVQQLETLSATLKRWDGEAVPRPPLARLKNAVLAEVAEQGVLRRADGRRVRFVGFGLAASVLFGLGAAVGLALGSLAGDAPRAVPAGPAPWQGPAPAPRETGPLALRLPDGPVLPEVQTFRAPPARVIPSPPTPPMLSPEDREAALAAALPAAVRLEEEKRFREETGLEPARVPDRLGRGGEMIVSERAATLLWELERSGVIDAVLRVREERKYAEPDPVRDTLRRPADVLGGVPSLDAARPIAELTVGRSAREQRKALDLWPLPVPPGGSSGGEDMIDPVAAWQAGVLRFEESVGDDADLVATVRNAARPILLPAGQILGGGKTDRVVAHDTWLPAALGEAKHVRVPCVSVRQGETRAEGGVRPLPFVAGPSIRALLARDVGADEVLRFVRDLRAALAGGRSMAWSLLDLYDEQADLALQEQAAVKTILARAPHGFVATDGAGHLVGIESTTLRGEAARLLLRRLWYGYAKEAHLRTPGGGSSVLPDASMPFGEALEKIREYPGTLQRVLLAADATVEGAQAATLEDESAGLVYEALQVAGKAVRVSALLR
jgi:hypothetical protein